MGQCCGGVVDVLFEPMDAGLDTWLADLRALNGQRVASTLVTHLGSGVKRLVAADDIYATPDDVPAQVTDAARGLLARGQRAGRDGDYILEAVTVSDFNIAVFGAGHVGSALVQTLSSLDCNIRWVDNRRNIFREPPRNVRAIETAQPALEVAALPPGSYYLVMTHSHALDFEICDRVLRRRDAAYCGLIGSRTKRRRFEKRYRQQGMPDTTIAALTCPIGVDGISGKKPAEIAVAVAAELLQARDRAVAAIADYPHNVRPLGR
jgi:xanthine dehydrogenase accessory factor